MSKSLLQRKIAALKELLRDKKAELKKEDVEKRIEEYQWSFDQESDELSGVISFNFSGESSLQVKKGDDEIFNSNTSENPASWVQSVISKTYREEKESIKEFRRLIEKCFLRNDSSPSLPNAPNDFQLRLVDGDSRQHTFFFREGKLWHVSERDSDERLMNAELSAELAKQIKNNNFELVVPATDLGNVEWIKYKFINGELCSSFVSKRGMSYLRAGLTVEPQATHFSPSSQCYMDKLKQALSISLGGEAKSDRVDDELRASEIAEPSTSNPVKTSRSNPKTLEEKLENIRAANNERRSISITSNDFISESGGRIEESDGQKIEYVDDASSKLKIKARPVFTQEIRGSAVNLELAGVELDGNRYDYFDHTTDLHMANFRGCVFSNVDFSKVKNLHTVLFANCKFGEGCVFPENFVFKSSNLKGSITTTSLEQYCRAGKISITPVAVARNSSGVALAMERIKGSTETAVGA